MGNKGHSKKARALKRKRRATFVATLVVGAVGLGFYFHHELIIKFGETAAAIYGIAEFIALE